MGYFMQNIWNIAAVLTGTVIGAGFASGQEISYYFLRYGKVGVFGVLISVILFTIISTIVLLKINKTGADTVAKYFGNNCPCFMLKFYKILSVSFMFITFCTMVTATGELFNEQFGVSKILGIVLIDIICIICFIKEEDGLVGINKLLVPMIIIVTIFVFLGCFAKSTPTFNFVDNFSASAVVYVSYNAISIVSVLTAVSGQVKNKTTAVLSAIISGIILLVLSLCVMYILSIKGVNGKIPMLNALDEISKILYMFVLFFALVTTAVSCGFGVINEFRRKIPTIIYMLVLSFVISEVGFDNLVSHFYSAFGYVGLGVEIYIVFDGKKYLKH